MCMIEGEPVHPATLTKRRARKEHRCDECGRTIEAGERYEYLWGICDGEQMVHKTCLHCQLRSIIRQVDAGADPVTLTERQLDAVRRHFAPAPSKPWERALRASVVGSPFGIRLVVRRLPWSR